MRDFDIAGALDFNGDQPFGPAEFGIRINQDRQNMPVDDVDQSVAVRDDLYLIPLSSSEVPRLASRVGFFPASVATTWPRHAMIPRGELCS